MDVKIEEAGLENCFLSEITVAELKFGAENSRRKEENRKTIEAFIPKFTIMPIYSCLEIYAREKARLRKKGIVIDDFDLLIGTTALAHDLTLVTNNEKHFKQMQKIKVVNWTVSKD